ncbi:MAG: hypothetical protein HYZ51_04050, partial [Candidatus Doudnabacteria bacterium]|nr:hypothetical protein [Candidatus Doudnabacteria bacterium]
GASPAPAQGTGAPNPAPSDVPPPDFLRHLLSPRAEDVRRPGGAEIQAAAAGIPVDTNFVCRKWLAQGPAPGTNGDVNLLPDHQSVGAVQAVVAHPTNPNIQTDG